jgi:DNA-directed RNA polymerase subunit RPC12/RpoP
MAVIKAVCPGCKRSFSMSSHAKKGSWLACTHCGVGLEVVHRDPLMLTWVANRPGGKRLSNWLLGTEHEEY